MWYKKFVLLFASGRLPADYQSATSKCDGFASEIIIVFASEIILVKQHNSVIESIILIMLDLLLTIPEFSNCIP